MPYVISSDAVRKENVNLVGGKAANLGEMLKAGFPVPKCFFVTVEAFHDFIESNKLRERIMDIVKKTDFSDVKSLTKSSDDIGKIILGGKMPEKIKAAIESAYGALSFDKAAVVFDFSKTNDQIFVAVRSSSVLEDIAKASAAGQYETFLNVRGKGSLVEHVKRCWASFYTPRAMYYRHKYSQPQDAGMGVIVQKMINSEKSGVSFTIDPVSPVKGRNHIIIEACWGLGETIVQGEVDPDRYIVNKENGEIIGRHIGRKTLMRTRDISTGKTLKQVVSSDKMNEEILDDSEIVALAAVCNRIERHYGKPQDIEWAFENGRMFITQTRAVTTLEEKEDIGSLGEAVESANIIAEGLGASPGIAVGTVKIISGLSELNKIQEGDILVTEMTSPDYVPAMEKSKAIVTDKGGGTCHAAIVSRELGIPCIVGTQTATSTLKNGQLITVDATHGKVYEGKIDGIEKEVSSLDKAGGAGYITKTKVKVNLAFPSRASKEIADKTDGVGLLRLEHMLTKAGMHPIEYIRQGKQDELIKIIEGGVGIVAEVFSPKPVWVRSLDARTDEFRNMEGGENEPKEDNPMLGWHGIRRSLDEPEILKCEFTAVKRLYERGLKNIGIMLPYVINASEIRKAKEIAREIGLAEDVEFGVMIETPAAALTMEEICREVDFVSIGSNDLTQGTLCVDRNNARISSLFDEMHMAMQFLLKRIVQTAKENNVKSSICGELPSNRRDAVELLVKAGISSVSVNIDAIDKVRSWIMEIEG